MFVHEFTRSTPSSDKPSELRNVWKPRFEAKWSIKASVSEYTSLIHAWNKTFINVLKLHESVFQKHSSLVRTQARTSGIWRPWFFFFIFTSVQMTERLIINNNLNLNLCLTDISQDFRTLGILWMSHINYFYVAFMVFYVVLVLDVPWWLLSVIA